MTIGNPEGPVHLPSMVGSPDSNPDTRPSRLTWRNIGRHKGLAGGVTLSVVVVAAVLLGPLIYGVSPDQQVPNDALLSPGPGHRFGTDQFGRDVLARVLEGGRYTITASAVIVLVGGFIGTVLGLVAGFWGGAIGFVVMRLIDLMLAFPGILLALMAASILGPGLVNGVGAVAVVLVPIYARVVEGATVAVRRLPYIEAAEVGGMSSPGIVWHHVLPNIRSGIVVLTSSWLGLAALWIAGLGFLVLGVQPPTPEWGALVHDGSTVISVAWWISAFPGFFLAMFVVGTNFVGDGLRDALDPTVEN